MGLPTDYIERFLNEEAYLEPFRIPELLKKKMTEEVVGEARVNLTTEIKCFEFFFQNGELKPTLDGVDQSGNKVCYPDLANFTEGELNYLDDRLKKELHPFPKSRYSHLLWMRTKHNRYGQIAVDAYEELARIYFEVSLRGEELFHKFCSVLQCFHRISVAIKYQLDECKSYLLAWLNNAQVPAAWKTNILDIILDSPLYKRNDLKGLTSLMISFLDGSNEDYFNRERYLRTCLQLAQKENVSTDTVFNLLGENELAQTNNREDDETSMILIFYYQKAAYYFDMGHNDDKYKEALTNYTRQKSKLKLHRFQYEFSAEHVRALNDEQNAIVDKILFTTGVHPLSHLVYGKGLTMSEELLEEEAREAMKHSFMPFAAMQVYDLNNNAKFLNEQDKLNYQKFQSYILHLQLSTIPILEKLIYKGIKTGKLTKESIVSFLNQTWLSNTLQSFTANETHETFSWIELLLPGIYEILSQLEAQVFDKNYRTNFILSIDSLSLKIEGIIRDLARLAGKSVTKIKEGESLEMNLEDLLREEDIKCLFDEDDILLWKFLLTKQGWNIRNNTAHAFYRPSDYERSKAILLLLAILRLCKYFSIVENSMTNK